MDIARKDYFSTSLTEPTINRKVNHSAVRQTILLKAVLLRVTKVVAVADE
jgi:hypothetical protein